MNHEAKEKVIRHIAGSFVATKAQRRGKEKWEIDGRIIVHMRFCTNPHRDGFTYPYNINQNTLRSDFEVWICGDYCRYYFIPIPIIVPIPIIEKIYKDPYGFVDKMHSTIRIVNVNTKDHKVNFSRKTEDIDISGYFCGTLNEKYWVDSGEEFISKEGKKIQVSVNGYERDPELRKKCIGHYGKKMLYLRILV